MASGDWDINEGAVERLRKTLPLDTVRDGRPWQESYPDLELLTDRRLASPSESDVPSVDLADYPSVTNQDENEPGYGTSNPLSVEEIDPGALRSEGAEIARELGWSELEEILEFQEENGDVYGAPEPGLSLDEGATEEDEGESLSAPFGADLEEEFGHLLSSQQSETDFRDAEIDSPETLSQPADLEHLDLPEWLSSVQADDEEGIAELLEWSTFEGDWGTDSDASDDGIDEFVDQNLAAGRSDEGLGSGDSISAAASAPAASGGERVDGEGLELLPEPSEPPSVTDPIPDELENEEQHEAQRELDEDGDSYLHSERQSDLPTGAQDESVEWSNAAGGSTSTEVRQERERRAIDDLLAAFEQQVMGSEDEQYDDGLEEQDEEVDLAGEVPTEVAGVDSDDAVEETERPAERAQSEVEDEGSFEIGIEEIAQRFQSVWADEEAKEAEDEGVELVVETRFRKPTILNKLGFQEISRRVGLEIGSSEVTFVCLAKKGKSYEVEAYGIVPFREIGQTGEVPETLLAATLQEVLGEGELRQADVFVTSQMIDAAVRTVELPKLSPKELANALRWAVRKEVPFDIESASLVYRVQDTLDGKKQRVLAVATDTGQLTRFTDILKKAGSWPSGVYPAGIALFDLFRRSKYFDPNACQVLVHIGTLTSHILLIENGRLAFERNVSTALDDFLTALTSSLFYEGQNVSLTQKEAYWILRRYGVLEPGSDDLTEDGIPLNEIAVSVRPVLEKLASEISRSLDYFRQKFGTERFEHVWVSGIGATVLNLCDMLEAETRVPTDRFDPFSEEAGLPLHCALEQIGEYGPALAVPLSLALGVDREFNLLPRNLRRSRTLRWAQKAAAYSALFAFILMATLSFQARLSLRIEENELAVLKDRYEALQKNQEQLRLLRTQQAALEKTLGELRESLPGEPKIPLYLHALSKLTPSKIALTGLEVVSRETALQQMRIQVSDDASTVVRLRGIVFPDPPNEGTHLASFVLALKTSSLFRNVRVEESRSSDLPKVGLEFSIVGELP